MLLASLHTSFLPFSPIISYGSSNIDCQHCFAELPLTHNLIVMESEDQKENKWLENWEMSRKRGKIFGGALMVGIGIALLLRQAGFELPDWLFTWEMLLIIFGFYVGVKHSFRHPGWIIMVLVGAVFLIDNIFPEITLGPMIWPILIIASGLLMIFKPRRRCPPNSMYWRKRWEAKGKRWEEKSAKWEERMQMRESTSEEDRIETVSVFAGVKKNIISKNFKGGEVTCVFGGAEINLMQADLQGKAVLELTAVFGGTKLIVPSHWEIQHHELVAVLGGIEDKRQFVKDIVADQGSVLVLKGTCFFGGIEINSY